MRSVAIGLTLLALGSASYSAQGPASAQTAPAFEVAAVRPNTSGGDRSSMSSGLVPNLWGEVVATRGTIYVTNAQLRDIIARAYGISPFVDRFLLTGGPENILSARFDITAKPPEAAAPSDAIPMLRALLAERFKLRIHRETRPTPLYAITVAREGRMGPQLRRSAHDCIAFYKARAVQLTSNAPALLEPLDVNGRSLCTRNSESNAPGPGALTMRDAGAIDQLLDRVQPFIDRAIVDATGLTGTFEWSLSFSRRSDSVDAPAPSIFTAFEQQLGLKLEPRTGPFEVFVIDSVEMPSAN